MVVVQMGKNVGVSNGIANGNGHAAGAGGRNGQTPEMKASYLRGMLFDGKFGMGGMVAKMEEAKKELTEAKESDSAPKAKIIALTRTVNLLEVAIENGVVLSDEQIGVAVATGEWPWAKPQEKTSSNGQMPGTGKAPMTARDMTIQYYNTQGWNGAKPAPEGIMQ